MKNNLKLLMFAGITFFAGKAFGQSTNTLTHGPGANHLLLPNKAEFDSVDVRNNFAAAMGALDNMNYNCKSCIDEMDTMFPDSVGPAKQRIGVLQSQLRALQAQYYIIITALERDANNPCLTLEDRNQRRAEIAQHRASYVRQVSQLYIQLTEQFNALVATYRRLMIQNTNRIVQEAQRPATGRTR